MTVARALPARRLIGQISPSGAFSFALVSFSILSTLTGCVRAPEPTMTVPFASALVPLAEQLRAGIAALRDGGYERPFGVHRLVISPALRTVLTRRDRRSRVVVMGMELELCLSRVDGTAYRLRTFVYPGVEQPTFIEFGGRRQSRIVDGRWLNTGDRCDRCAMRREGAWPP
jgi:hypothetical protein